jgi:hypothetical protein
MNGLSAQLALRVCVWCQQRLQLVIHAAALSHAASDVLPLCFVALRDLAAGLSILDFTLHSAAVIFKLTRPGVMIGSTVRLHTQMTR